MNTLMIAATESMVNDTALEAVIGGTIDPYSSMMKAAQVFYPFLKDAKSPSLYIEKLYKAHMPPAPLDKQQAFYPSQICS